MTKALQFNELSAELMESGITSTANTKKSKKSKEAVTDAVAKLAEDVAKRMAGVKKHIQEVTPPKPLSPPWSLLCSTGYPLSKDSGRKTAYTGLCSVVIAETSSDCLSRRETFLGFPNAGELRFLLWLEINLWLSWNSATLSPQVFNYWDMIPDQMSQHSALYSGEKAKKMSQLMQEDIKCLNSLGDFLSRCPALANNRDAPVYDRVISLEVKAAIDTILEVSNIIQKQAS